MRGPEAYLLDIVTFANRAMQYTGTLSQAEFANDLGVQDQVIRCLMVVGEAARRLPDQTRSRYPSIRWAEVIGMRNHLAHEYDDVDINLVWETVNEDLPSILRALGHAQ